jgi:hypothetical protein
MTFIFIPYRTNLLTQLMTIPGFEFDDHVPNFPDRHNVLDYLQKFCDKNSLRKYIKVCLCRWVELFVCCSVQSVPNKFSLNIFYSSTAEMYWAQVITTYEALSLYSNYNIMI